MNKLKTIALVCVCTFCVTAFIGILNPSYVQALGFEENTSFMPEVTMPEFEETQDENKGKKVEFKTETRVEEIPYGFTETGIDTIPKGTRQVLSAGIPGTVKRTYLVKYIDGQKADEALYTEQILSTPVNEVANVGVGGTVTSNDGTVYNYNYRKQMEATAYTYLPPYTTMTTATGQTLRKGIVAVDPKVIPLHTKMFITGTVEYGLGVAEDTGGAIKGNIIDLAYMSYDECIRFGRRQMQVYILD